MKKTILSFFLCLYSYFSVAQTREESRRIRRKDPTVPSRRAHSETEFKLKGYEDTTQLIYTSIAQCEMSCLNADESTLRRILKEGTIVLQKSQLRAIPKKYTLEFFISKIAYSVVVSPANTSLLVVSFRRLNKKISCNCK